MGTVFQVPWTRIPDWEPPSRILHEAGFDIAALALARRCGDARRVRRAIVPSASHSCMGSEGDGLCRQALDAADTVVTIPMTGGVDSLNVASAAPSRCGRSTG